MSELLRTGFSRRRGLAAGLACLAGSGSALQAQVLSPWSQLIAPFTGGLVPRQQRVVLELPRLADNGLSVPLSVRVAGSPGAGDLVRRVILLSNRNPRPVIAEFEWGQGSVRAEVATRVRLNGSQEVMALAQTSDGLWWQATAEVEVTESACLDAG